MNGAAVDFVSDLALLYCTWSALQFAALAAELLVRASARLLDACGLRP